MHHRTIQRSHQPDATIFQCCFRGRAGRPGRPSTQQDYHHDTKVKPETATAVIELLMVGGKTPDTCWAVKKFRIINWKIVVSGWWFIWIVRWCIDLQTLNLKKVQLFICVCMQNICNSLIFHTLRKTYWNVFIF